MLQIKDLTFDAWGRRFFDQATVSLPKDAKVGLVGRNGVGKSTLFKLILGKSMRYGETCLGSRTCAILSRNSSHLHLCERVCRKGRGRAAERVRPPPRRDSGLTVADFTSGNRFSGAHAVYKTAETSGNSDYC